MYSNLRKFLEAPHDIFVENWHTYFKIIEVPDRCINLVLNIPILKNYLGIKVKLRVRGNIRSNCSVRTERSAPKNVLCCSDRAF